MVREPLRVKYVKGKGNMRKIILIITALFFTVQISTAAKNTTASSNKTDSRLGIFEITELMKTGVNSTLPEGKTIGEDYFPEGTTPLMIASFFGYVDRVKSLIARGANVNAQTDFSEDDIFENSQTPLSYAIDKNHTEIVKILLDNKAKVSNEPKGSTPLVSACAGGNTEIVQMLIAHGVDVNVPAGENFTPLFAATVSGKLEIVKILVDAGADLKVKDFDDRDILFYAEESGNPKIVEYLRQKIKERK